MLRQFRHSWASEFLVKEVLNGQRGYTSAKKKCQAQAMVVFMDEDLIYGDEPGALDQQMAAIDADHDGDELMGN